jgi:Putative Zn-dependent protease, contains TPR repeats
MKKLLVIALVLLISVQLGAQPPRSPQGRPQGQGGQAPAQSKDMTDALSALEKAKKDAENASKAINPTTWTKLSTCYVNLYEAPVKALWVGASKTELRILLAGQRVVKSEEQTIQGEQMTVDTYADKLLYFDSEGSLIAWKVASNLIPENTLQEALKSANKAAEVDTKNQRTKDIVALLDRIKTQYANAGISAYRYSDYANASVGFEEAYNLSVHKMVNAMDTSLVYYAGMTAMYSNDFDRAIKFITIAIDNGYDSDGEAYSFLAEAYKGKSNIAKAKEVLNAGFQKYPNNQDILISMINAYLESNDDPEKILELIRPAQRNDPNNASLYHAEGEVWRNLDKLDEAMRCFAKSTEVNPNYVLGYYSMGAAYYEQALEIQRKAADEPDNAKYEVLVKEMEGCLESALVPLEKGFTIAVDADVKLTLSEYLKNIYYRFREKSPEHTAAFEKYNQYFQSNASR